MEQETTRTFKNLNVWQAARKLRQDIAALVKLFPPIEKLRLADQMVRASRSVTANIAEGYGRYHFQENIQFCRQARGSLFELLDHLSVCEDEGYISQGQLDDFRAHAIQTIKLLNGYIGYLKSQKEES
ncbi:MAG TPA: four helix bundle protein [Deltaproteobacteria bacterium]|nr:four helix bundle protein [Deltaproteobacteria bacterium]